MCARELRGIGARGGRGQLCHVVGTPSPARAAALAACSGALRARSCLSLQSVRSQIQIADKTSFKITGVSSLFVFKKSACAMKTRVWLFNILFFPEVLIHLPCIFH